MTSNSRDADIDLNKRFTSLNEAIEAGMLKKALKHHQLLLKEMEVAREQLTQCQGLPSEPGSTAETEVKTGSKTDLRNALAEISVGMQASQIKLNELKDWQGFATNPKRVDLCAAMANLHGNLEMPLQLKAREIRKLQDEWKKLGPSDSREGQRLWKKFKKLSDAAYAPCTDHFEALKQRRNQNLQRQREIIDSLEYYLANNDWTNTNWSGASAIIKKAKTEWRQFQDVPRNKKRRADQRFNDVLAALQLKLSTEQTVNQKKKQDLIEALDTALANHDGGAAGQIEKLAKNLQSQWKKVGITLRREDQKLWREFRALCDKVFALREAAGKQKARTVKTQENQLEKKQTIKNESAGPDRDKQSITRLQILSSLCDQLEQQEISVSDFETRWVQSEQPDAFWLAIVEGRKIELVNRCQQNAADIAAYISLQEIETQRKKLCVQIESLAGLKSPDTDANIKTQLQVERLQRELSRAEKDVLGTGAQLQSLQLAWHSLGHIDAAAGELRDRFARAEQALQR